MKITCAKHGVELGNANYCEPCLKESMDARNVMMEKLGLIGVSSSFPMQSDEVLVDGVLTLRNHEGGYLGWNIPKELQEELNAHVERRVKEYQSKCGCLACLQRREEKEKHERIA